MIIKMNEQRRKKLEAVAQELVSNYIFNFLEDSEKEFWIITITNVKLSPDISYLDIYVSCFKNEDILPKTLAKHNYEIQHAFNKAIPLRKYPKIRFRYDSQGKVWETICKTINSLDINSFDDEK